MTIFINGNVITLDDKNKKATSFIIENEVFKAVGSNEEILSLAKKDDIIINLKGKTVVPGFNDAHMHFLNYGITKNAVNITNISSIDKMINESKKYISDRNIPEGEWIVSRGWNDNLFEENRLPSRYDLDKISTVHPIYFSRICGHLGVTNSLALKLMNIDENTPNPSGGVIDKENGVPTGILRENALNCALDAVQPISKTTIKELLKNVFNDALSVGLTSISTEDMWQSGNLVGTIEAYRELEEENNLPIRFVQQVYLKTPEDFEEAKKHGYKTGVGTDKFKIGPVKIYQDGSLGGRTAAMINNYNDIDSTGVLIHPQEELDEIVKKSHDYGFQVCSHAIGDRSMETLLNSYEKVYKSSDNTDLRLCIIHCQFTNKNLLERFKKLNIVANVQPSFVMSDYPIVETAVGKERAYESYAWKSLINKGIHTCFSSDAPIESFNPLESIYAAVTRKDLKGNPIDGWNTHECISVEEALKGYCVEPAYFNFEENIKGTISEGKLADFVILSEDIMSIDKDRIKDIEVLETYVGGVREFEKNH